MDNPSTSKDKPRKIRCSITYCFVPMCSSNSIKFPDKKFLTVPQDPKIRQKWMKAAGKRNLHSPKSVLRCCEDHFDMEKDLENWMKYTHVGGNLILKKGVVPHKFQCQQRMQTSKPRSLLLKRKQQEILENKQGVNVEAEDVQTEDEKTTSKKQLDANGKESCGIEGVNKTMLDRFDSSQIVIKKVSSYEKEPSAKKYGACRCCLKEGVHTVGNVPEMLECLNVEVSTEPSLSTLVCSLCSNFLCQVKRFRDMVAASQGTLLAAAKPLLQETVPIKLEFDIDTGQNVKEEIEDGWPESTWHSEGEDRKPDLNTWSESDDSMTEVTVKQEVTEEPDNKMNVTAQELRNMEKLKVAQLNLQIRENLSTILQFSTIIPFTTTKADQFECIYCDELFANFEVFRNHVENHNEDFEFKLQALKLLALKLDLELILRVDVSHIKCKICEEEFKSLDSLVEHLVDEHEKKYHAIRRDPPHNVLCFNMRLDVLTCLDCGKTFNAFKGLLMHMNQHYGSYLCFICGSKFLYETSYKMHMSQESKKDVRIKCKLCGATYGRKDHLARHMRNKHPK